jgi:integrase
MRRYYLHTRHNGVFYAGLVDPQTGRKLTARSTGTKSRDEALLKIAEWLKTGILTGRVRKPRTLEAAAGIENILRSIRKTDLDSDDALRIVQALKDRGLIDIAAVKSGKGAVSFTEFLEEFWDYESSPYIREKRAHGHSIGKRHCYERMSRFLACTTGMRSGEVLALRQGDIEERTLNVRHSWSAYDGLKVPKNGEARRVPLLPEVRAKLLELAMNNPHGPEGFIFYGNLADKPVDRSVLPGGLHDTLSAIGINAEARGVVFHSWRHYYAARMADRMTADQVSRITGHKSRAIFEEYADHSRLP